MAKKDGPSWVKVILMNVLYKSAVSVFVMSLGSLLWAAPSAEAQGIRVTGKVINRSAPRSLPEELEVLVSVDSQFMSAEYDAEPFRACRRQNYVRDYCHGKTKQVFTGGPGTGRADG